MHRIDLPPLWLLAFCVLAWIIARLDQWSLSFGGAWADLLAGLLIGGSLLVILLAVQEMRRARTAIMPRQEASRLVTDGIFGRSRNPIYLGFVLILLGWVLRLDAPLALPLVPAYAWLIERRFVLPEEAALSRRFGATFTRYRQATRRWL